MSDRDWKELTGTVKAHSKDRGVISVSLGYRGCPKCGDPEATPLYCRTGETPRCARCIAPPEITPEVRLMGGLLPERCDRCKALLDWSLWEGMAPDSQVDLTLGFPTDWNYSYFAHGKCGACDGRTPVYKSHKPFTPPAAEPPQPSGPNS